MSQDQWLILEATLEGKRIASLLLLFSNEATEYFTPAILPEFRHLQALSLLIFEGMNFAISKEILIWNWGGTWKSQKGVYDFKRKWGAEESTYNYFCAILDESILDRSREEISEAYPHFYVVPFDALEVE
jgi:lipid II:glycine glycyltransferase (peptidoglycan interpeptide bridge formation enzyme)